MKIILAPDSFKGNLTSMEVAEAMETGIERVLPGADCIKIPMADGGEGTVQSLLDAVGGELISCKVTGPAGQSVTAGYGMLADNSTAVIEMAAASGLALVSGKTMNPLTTTSFGTGELIRHALDRGAQKIILGIGGSATNDAGVGMAQALGVVFRTGDGRAIHENGAGGMLQLIESMELKDRHPKLDQTRILVACDVDNPLTGENGAACVFAPQKGADADMVKLLDDNLKHLAGVIKRETGIDVDAIPGAGAAGGLGAGLLVFAGAELRSGIEIISRATSIETHLRSADLVFTGEGRVDYQTAFGKTPAGIARLAAEYGVPVIAIGGGLADDAGEVFTHGINGLEAAIARDMPLDEALANSREYIANAAERVIRLILIGQGMKKQRNNYETFQFRTTIFRALRSIILLMDDLGAAMAGEQEVLMLGGGNPAHIAEVQAFFRARMQYLLDKPTEFARVVGDYDPPQGNKAFLSALADLLNHEYGWGLTVDNVALTTGSQSAFFLLFNMVAGEFAGGLKKKILLPMAPEYIGYGDVGLVDDLFVANRPTIEKMAGRSFQISRGF